MLRNAKGRKVAKVPVVAPELRESSPRTALQILILYTLIFRPAIMRKMRMFDVYTVCE